ncbi:hypothetical protein [Actinomycetospora termitidis]|uniref:Uncharacterized protein n=1 Tax=Actinomycetospora termitidis TaxID=3053470 RepID=A0ABT7MJJ6_9PSEU|nr:hypothetical protein [Actinomycetospora sp. Odt1-22]MDL5159538.1 hypothetical protein [Actinomycetospora sp. Odt1-22]
MGVLPRLALFLTTGLVGLGGTACAAEPAPAPAPSRAAAADEARTVDCPDAQCTVTVTPGTVVDAGDAGTVTVTDVGDDTVTTTAGGSRITSGRGGSNTVDGVSYRVTSVRDGAATLDFGDSSEDEQG